MYKPESNSHIDLQFTKINKMDINICLCNTLVVKRHIWTYYLYTRSLESLTIGLTAYSKHCTQRMCVTVKHLGKAWKKLEQIQLISSPWR